MNLEGIVPRDVRLKPEVKPKTQICPICRDGGLLKPDGQSASSDLTLRRWFTETKPCPFCAAGEKDRQFRLTYLEKIPEAFTRAEVLL